MDRKDIFSLRGLLTSLETSTYATEKSFFFSEILDSELKKNFLAPGYVVGLIDTENLRYILVIDQVKPAI